MTMWSVFGDKSNGILTHGVQRTTQHTLTGACLHEGPTAKQIKQISIFANLLSTNIGHKNQQNYVLTHIQTTAMWLKLLQQKLLFIPAIFEAKSAVAKCKPPITTVQLH